MDSIGEIIEHEIVAPEPPTPNFSSTGFPDPKNGRKHKVSRWKLKNKEGIKKEVSDLKDESQNNPKQELSEMEKIDKENRERMSKMSEEEILAEQQELLKHLNPKLVQGLLNRSKKNENSLASQAREPDQDLEHHSHHEHSEGYNGWIGEVKTKDGITNLSQLDKEDLNDKLGISNKTVRFDDGNTMTIDHEDSDENIEGDSKQSEDVTNVNELANPNAIAPEDYQINNDDDDIIERNNTVHFTKPENREIDINDPDFFDRLHEKYYPDLPKETEKLSWMTTPLPKQVSTTYESISDMRFDFKGNLIQIDINEETESQKGIPTYLGLHHHSENPQLAGYTLSELAHLSRSVVPGQRCLSIQTLGRILHKLCKHELNILPVADEVENQDLQKMVVIFEKMMWDLIDELRIVESLKEAADEKKTKNLSVRNYAIEALWLLQIGGGVPVQDDDATIEEIL
ncbi:uncharacterized protein KGF55_002056 [Candida pseudojiufengensis]|uniref:uncharacterized protein n=1 Tax=Candida pseudojiufengensis TaxID=497109 RepID=UPI00222487EE|nr:uncharacterized protein KGF55_002056 [Candida pseudojiufengensis]KAI5964114.1 hypothetical protein KGF55_002056 [Candida pseudojiufengensis]